MILPVRRLRLMQVNDRSTTLGLRLQIEQLEINKFSLLQNATIYFIFFAFSQSFSRFQNLTSAVNDSFRMKFFGRAQKYSSEHKPRAPTLRFSFNFIFFSYLFSCFRVHYFSSFFIGFCSHCVLMHWLRSCTDDSLSALSLSSSQILCNFVVCLANEKNCVEQV